MQTCPNCGKVLTYEDYDTYFVSAEEDTVYRILCSSCGYDEAYDDKEQHEKAEMECINE